MGELADKVKGATNEVVGKTKQGIGRATDNPKLEGEGVAQEIKGKTQKVAGEVKGALGNKV